MSSREKRILIISHDVVGTYMAGPGIRYFHMARVLARKFRVTLAAPAPISLDGNLQFETLPYDEIGAAQLYTALKHTDVIIVPALFVAKIPGLRHFPFLPVIVDAYDPFVIEALARGVKDVSMLQQELAIAYLRGDFFVCASEYQRDWLLGILEAFGRINGDNFAADNTLRRLVDVVPYGLPKHTTAHGSNIIKGVWNGISSTDRVVLWGGGLWKWLDPLTAIKAIGEVWKERNDVRLIFPGTKHPNRKIPESVTHNTKAKELARKLGLLDKAVFFGDWVPYEQWGDVLLESDVALSLHFDSIETHFAYRSRILEYISAGLPIITACGTATSDLVDQYNLGYVVDYQDSHSVAKAFRSILSELPYHPERFQPLRESLSWERVLQPLIDFCKSPHSATDKTDEMTIGAAFYLSQISQLQEQVKGYEKGKFIRFMRWLKSRNVS